VNIVRFDDTGGVPAKNGTYILFLNDTAPNKPEWTTADFWFGIQPYYNGTAASVKRVAEMMAEEARWAPVRKLGDRTKPEQIPERIEIADGADKEVALEALSQLSNYQPTPPIIVFLNQKMKDKDEQIALKAAIISCYSGDWSGFDILLQHVGHHEPALRLTAVAQLADVRFRTHAKRVVPLLLERLRLEKDPGVLERAIESLGNYPSRQVLDAIQPFLKHENERVRARTKLVVDWMTRDLGKQQP
jgi:HEAT repeat protein